MNLTNTKKRINITNSFISVSPNSLLHDTKFTDTQLLVDAYRIGWYNMFVAGQFTW